MKPGDVAAPRDVRQCDDLVVTIFALGKFVVMKSVFLSLAVLLLSPLIA